MFVARGGLIGVQVIPIRPNPRLQRPERTRDKMTWLCAWRDGRWMPKWMAALFMATALVACGGGGSSAGGGGGSGSGGASKTLFLSLSYPSAQVFVWQPASLEARITGLEGNPPTCAVFAGQLPSGMSLQGDTCRVSGTPLAVGSAVATIRITVKGFEGQVDTVVQFGVLGPSAAYQLGSPSSPGQMALGSLQNVLPPPLSGQPDAWIPQAGQSLGYQLTSSTVRQAF
jgi:hypothetical protein